MEMEIWMQKCYGNHIKTHYPKYYENINDLDFLVTFWHLNIISFCGNWSVHAKGRSQIDGILKTLLTT